MNLLLQGIFCFVFGKRVKRRSPLTFEAKETYPIACIDLSLLIFFCKSFLRLLHIWPHYPSRSCFPDFVTCYWQHSSSTRAWVIRWLRFFSFRWIRIFPSQILYISYFPYHLPLSDVRYAENYSTYFCLVFLFVSEIYRRLIRVYVFFLPFEYFSRQTFSLLSVLWFVPFFQSYPWHSQKKEIVIITKTKTENHARSLTFSIDLWWKKKKKIERHLLCQFFLFVFYLCSLFSLILFLDISFALSLHISLLFPVSTGFDGCKRKLMTFSPPLKNNQPRYASV